MTIKQKLINLLDDVFALKGEEETQTILLKEAFQVSIEADSETGNMEAVKSFSGTSIFGLFDNIEFLQNDDFFMKPLEYHIGSVYATSDNSANVDIYLKIPANINPIGKCILIKNGKTSWIDQIHESNNNPGSYYTDFVVDEMNYIKRLFGEPQE